MTIKKVPKESFKIQTFVLSEVFFYILVLDIWKYSFHWNLCYFSLDLLHKPLEMMHTHYSIIRVTIKQLFYLQWRLCHSKLKFSPKTAASISLFRHHNECTRARVFFQELFSWYVLKISIQTHKHTHMFIFIMCAGGKRRTFSCK